MNNIKIKKTVKKDSIENFFLIQKILNMKSIKNGLKIIIIEITILRVFTIKRGLVIFVEII